MKTPFSLFTLAAVTVAGSAQAQLQPPANRPVHTFGLSYRAGFNISADFENLGGVPPSANPGPASGGNVDRVYDDGYNRVDISGNAGDQTWFWGYENADQIQGSTIAMHSSSVSGVSSRNREDDPQHGIELTYEIELGETGKLGFWGFEAAFNYTHLDITDNRTLIGNLTRITDTYSLGGIVPPLPPYSGTFNGPGPVIGITPTRTEATIANGAVISGRRSIDAHLFGLRLGPYWQVPFSEHLSAVLSGGLVLAGADSQFTYRETVSISGAGEIFRTGRDTSDEFLFGGYLSAKVLWALSDSWSLFGAVQYQNIGDYSQEAGSKSATVDLGESVFVSTGVGFSF